MVKKAKPVKRSKKGEPKLPSWWQPGFVPCVARDPSSAIGEPFNRVYLLASTFQGVLAVQRWANVGSMVGVRDRTIPATQMKHYVLRDDLALQSALDELKPQMLTEGATPEAVRLVHEHSPFTEEELSTMAEKLKTKTAAKAKADKPAKAAAAPKTAKPKGEGAVGTARDFKYKHEMTPKQAAEKVREGTWTGRMVEIIMSHKDAASAREELSKDKTYSDKRLDFGWAEKKGFITIAA